MSKDIQIYREKVSEIMKDKTVFNDLLKNTFKGLDASNVPQALIQGQMRGFSIQDFMVGNVYAIGFWNKELNKQDFSLITSIGHARKVAMRSGQSGKSEPVWTDDEHGKIVSCKVTIYKHGGHEGGYTATVYFDEYNTDKNQWKTRPRTMIAKVAEMHALRMAFPEEMSEMYSEEESGFIEAEIENDTLKEHRDAVSNINDMTALEEYYETHKGLGKDFDAIIIARKKELQTNDTNHEEIS